MTSSIKVISLKSDQERRTKFSEAFSKYFKYCFFDAVDGRNEKEKIRAYNFENNGTFRGRVLGINERACSVSHFEALRETVNEKTDRILILEDDLESLNKTRFDITMFMDLEDDGIYILGGQQGLKLEFLFNLFWRLNLIFTGRLFWQVPMILHGRIYRTCCYLMTNNLANYMIKKFTNLSVADDWKTICRRSDARLFYCPIFSHPRSLADSHIAFERSDIKSRNNSP